jgi:hypothetical protein
MPEERMDVGEFLGTVTCPGCGDQFWAYLDDPMLAPTLDAIENEIWKMLRRCDGNVGPGAVAECARSIAATLNANEP